MNNGLSKFVVEPFFFGDNGRRLFGCSHKPVKGNLNKGIIILCQSVGQEYIRSHRALFQLASRLAKNGYAVLRFDYYGCGDSAGDFEEGSLEAWLTDLDTAISEMQGRYGCQEICLIGYRIGAALAFKEAIRSTKIKHLVLWEIVTNGTLYLQELAQMQAVQDKQIGCRTKKSKTDKSLPAEILGFPLSPELIRNLKTLELKNMTIPKHCRSLVISNQHIKTSTDIADILKRSQRERQTILHIEDHLMWKHRLYKRLIPTKTLSAIVEWIESEIS